MNILSCNFKILTRDEAGCVPLGVEAPDGSAMAVIRAQPLSVQRVPHVGVVVLGTAVNMQEQPEFYPQTYINLFHRSNRYAFATRDCMHDFITD